MIFFKGVQFGLDNRQTTHYLKLRKNVFTYFSQFFVIFTAQQCCKKAKMILVTFSVIFRDYPNNVLNYILTKGLYCDILDHFVPILYKRLYSLFFSLYQTVNDFCKQNIFAPLFSNIYLSRLETQNF